MLIVVEVVVVASVVVVVVASAVVIATVEVVIKLVIFAILQTRPVMTEWLKELGLLNHLLEGVVKLVLKKRPKPSDSNPQGTQMNCTQTDYAWFLEAYTCTNYWHFEHCRFLFCTSWCFIFSSSLSLLYICFMLVWIECQ